MKQKIIIILIGISFVLSQLQIFLPFVTHKTNLLGMLVINLLLLFVISSVQRRPSIEAFDSNHEDYWDMEERIEEFDVQAYFVASVLTLLVALGVIVGRYAFGLEREAIYDVVLLSVASLVFAWKGKNLSSAF